jgi:hypothetical protein
MNISRFFAVLLVLLGGSPLPAQKPAAAQAAPRAVEEKPAPPLIRMDLLAQPPVEAAPPKRNIFSPRVGQSNPAAPVVPSAPAAGGPALAVLSSGGAGGAVVDPAAQAAAQPPAAPAFTIDLKFVGYVDSAKTRKIIGLVVFQGQARAVVEGEVISEGIRIGKISHEEIEVVMPDSSTRTFSLEGEDR